MFSGAACSKTEFPVFRSPPYHLRVAFLDHVRQTGAPETFPGLHLGPFDRNEPFVTLATFEIDRKKRPGRNKAYCPMCKRHDHYLHGCFVHFTRLQAIGAIGDECAAKEQRDIARKAYERARDRDADEDFILDSLPKIPAVLAEIDRLRPAADEALRLHRLLRRDAPSAVAQLRHVNRTGGRLVVAERIDRQLTGVGPAGFRGNADEQTRDLEFGILQGSTAVIKSFNPVTELERISRSLAPWNSFYSLEQALEAIVAMTERDRKWAVATLRAASNDIRQQTSRIDDVRQFFTQRNIDVISRWAAHHEHSAPFVIEFSGRTLKIVGNGDHLRGTVGGALADFKR